MDFKTYYYYLVSFFLFELTVKNCKAKQQHTAKIGGQNLFLNFQVNDKCDKGVLICYPNHHRNIRGSVATYKMSRRFRSLFLGDKFGRCAELKNGTPQSGILVKFEQLENGKKQIHIEMSNGYYFSCLLFKDKFSIQLIKNGSMCSNLTASGCLGYRSCEKVKLLGRNFANDESSAFLDDFAGLWQIGMEMVPPPNSAKAIAGNDLSIDSFSLCSTAELDWKVSITVNDETLTYLDSIFARDLLSNLDFEQDPCKDFYAFTCKKANSAAEEVFPDEVSKLDKIEGHGKSIAEKVVYHVKKICGSIPFENPKNYNVFRENVFRKINDTFFEQFGGFPALIGEHWHTSIKSSESFWKMIGKLSAKGLHFLLNADYLSVYEPHPRHVMSLFPPHLSVQDLLENLKFQKLLKRLKIETFENLDFLPDYLDEKANEQAINDFFSFQMQLANEKMPEMALNYHNTFTLNSLSNDFPAINWTAFFDGLGYLENVRLSEKKFNSFSLVVPDLRYVKFLDKFTREKQWTNRTMFNFISVKILKMIDYFQKYENQLTLLAPYAQDYIYVKEVFDRDAVIDDVRRQSDAISEAFAEILNATKWATDAFKQKALAKLLKIKKNIGWPTQIYGDFKSIKEVDEYHKEYANFPSRTDLDWFDALFELIQAKYRTDRNTFQKSPDEILSVSQEFYEITANTLTIPLSSLRRPYYDPLFPQSYNFACIGSTIGHEMAHAFDDRAIQFFCDFDQNHRNCSILDEGSAKGFEKMKKCVENFFEKKCCPIEEDWPVKCVNGSKTLGENIPDIAGQQAAYNAYKKYIQKNRNGIEEEQIASLEHFSHYQLFWISAAQQWCVKLSQETLIRRILNSAHSPQMCRVNQVFQNLPDFAKDFNCPVGSPMRPTEDERCTVWS